ncbi:hypothetical protein GGS26DRAFT_594681 [Hypomontagnella submonticulosa]|nr:hypothetical protein GGS26DRAFT_594681 [Hypomontagnella submonticulosa]
MKSGALRSRPADVGDVYQLEDALDELFQAILEVLADTDVFSHLSSPSIFVVYAHDNDTDQYVHTLIRWLGTIRSRTLSDRAPLFIWSTREDGPSAVSNILNSQLRLLPRRANTKTIDNVDKVVLCGSEILKQYYENEFSLPYIRDIEKAYVECDASPMIPTQRQRVRAVVENRCRHVAFHHVLTELAFLKCRISHGPEDHGVIPVSLDGDPMRYLPCHDNCDIVLKLESSMNENMHRLFFKLLGQVYSEEHVLVNNFQGCYDQASKLLQQETAITQPRAQQIINQEMLKTQNALTSLGSTLLKSLRLEKEREYQHYANLNFRGMHAKYMRSVDETTTAKMKLEVNKLIEVLEWLSTSPFLLHHKSVSDALMPGSGIWITRHSAFCDWLESTSSSTLLIHGVRGCGKSSLFSVIVDQLLAGKHSSAHPLPCAYYYCADSPSEPDRASPEAILRSLLRQLAVDQSKTTIHPKVWSVYEKLVAAAEKERIDLAMLKVDHCVDLILEITADKPAHIALDAIDELQDEHRFVLIEALQRIVDESAGNKLLLTSRNDAQIEGQLHSAIKIRVSATENRDDIQAFIEAQLNTAVSSRSLPNGHASGPLLENIRKSLIDGAGEMFLWIQLQLKFLCRKKTEVDIIVALKAGLVGELDRIYDKTYQAFLALDDSARHVVQSVFSWILFAKSPLTVNALRCAVAMNPYFSERPREVALPDLLDVCHNLVVLDSAMNTLRVCHPSVRDYMRRQEMFSVESANSLLAGSCLQQCSLGLGSPPGLFSEIDLVGDFSLYSGLYWAVHLNAAQAADMHTDLTLELMARFVFNESEESSEGCLSLVFITWLEWVKQVSEKLPQYHKLKRTLENLTSSNGPSPVLTACAFGLCNLLELTLSRMSGVDLEQISDTGHTPIYLASAHGHGGVVSKLIEHKADANVNCGSYGNPLQVACFRGFINVVKVLLEHGVSPHSSAAFCSAFEAACEGGSEEVALFLIKEGSALRDKDDCRLALQKAAEAGFRDVVEYLMQPGLAKTFARNFGETDFAQEAILGAIKRGHVAVLRSFLQSHPNMASKLPKDAMAVAALHGQVKVLSLLHDLGMDMEEEGKFGSPLRSASLMGNELAVRQLIEWGADPKASGKKGDSLQAAALKGHVRIMWLLILSGAQVNKKGKPCGTCIQAAAYYGQMEAVKLLLEEGAIIYLEGKFEDALHAAVRGGHDEIASFLVEKGYGAPRGRQMPSSLQGNNPSRQFWYTTDMLRIGFVREARNPSVEETDDKDGNYEDALKDAQQEDNGEILNRYYLVLAATIGDIPMIRQQLHSSRLEEHEIEQALTAAVAKGKSDPLQFLLDNSLKFVRDPRDAMEKALVAAVRYGQTKAIRTILDSLNNTLRPQTWAAALNAATSAGDREIVEEILALDWLAGEWISDLSEYGDLLGFRDILDPQESDLDWDRAEESPLGAVRIYEDVLETTATSGHREIAKLVWDWVLQKGPEIMAEGIAGCIKLSTIAASFASAQILEACLRLEEACSDHANRPTGYLVNLLSAAVRESNIDTFQRLYELIEQGDYRSSDLTSSFIEACKNGFDKGVLILADRGNRVALNDDQIAQGIVAASTSGQEKLLTKLFSRLEGRENHTWIINQKLEEALISAAGVGELGSIRCILDNTDVREHSNYMTIITRVLITACEWGRKYIAILCLQEGADAERIVPRATPDLFPSLTESLLASHSLSLRPYRNYPRHEDDQEGTRESDNGETNALQASLRGFIGIHVQAEEKQQEALILLLLGHGCDPNSNGGEDESPLRIAVQWANDRVVKALLEYGAELETISAQESRSLVLSAATRESGVALRVVLQLLKAGAHIPTSADGSLDPCMMDVMQNAHCDFGFDGGLLSKGHMRYTSEETARNMLDGGIRELITIIFDRLPHQVADHRVFGDMLHLVAVAGDLYTVERLIRHGVDVNHIMSHSDSALGAAAQFGHLQIMKVLMEAGAKVHPGAREGGTHCSIQEPLIKAIVGRKILALKLLLDNGADPTLDLGPTPITAYAPIDFPDTLLLLAVRSRDVAVTRCLLRAGVDVKTDGLPLVTAAYDGDLDMVRCLLDAGANVNILAVYGTIIREQRICSPLYTACEEGHIEVVRELLKRGADACLDVGEHFGLPLVVAAHEGRVEIVEILLEGGCNPAHRSKGAYAISQDYRTKFRQLLRVRDSALSACSPVVPPPVYDYPVETEFYSQGLMGMVRHSAVTSAWLGRHGTHTALQLLEILLEAIPEPHERKIACLEVMHRASRTQDSGIFEALLDYVQPDSYTLILACRCGSVKAVRKILDYGVPLDPDTGDMVPLREAAINMNVEMVRFLLANGAKAEKLGSRECPGYDLYNMVAMAISSYSSGLKRGTIQHCEDTVKFLIEAAKDAGLRGRAYQYDLDISLGLACHVGSVEMTRMLLDAGARVNSQTDAFWHRPYTHENRQSPLFIAIDDDHPSMLPLLFQRGADPNQTRTIPAPDQQDHSPEERSECSSSEWDKISESSAGAASLRLSGTRENITLSSATHQEEPYAPEAEAPKEPIIQTALEACLGKKSPILLQTFLRHASTAGLLYFAEAFDDGGPARCMVPRPRGVRPTNHPRARAEHSTIRSGTSRLIKTVSAGLSSSRTASLPLCTWEK